MEHTIVFRIQRAMKAITETQYNYGRHLYGSSNANRNIKRNVGHQKKKKKLGMQPNGDSLNG